MAVDPPATELSPAAFVTIPEASRSCASPAPPRLLAAGLTSRRALVLTITIQGRRYCNNSFRLLVGRILLYQCNIGCTE